VQRQLLLPPIYLSVFTQQTQLVTQPGCYVICLAQAQAYYPQQQYAGIIIQQCDIDIFKLNLQNIGLHIECY